MYKIVDNSTDSIWILKDLSTTLKVINRNFPTFAHTDFNVFWGEDEILITEHFFWDQDVTTWFYRALSRKHA